MSDNVDHPSHYTSHPSGVETVDCTEHLSFNIGNCVKYLTRRLYKGRELEDVQKAEWYAKRELGRDLPRIPSVSPAGLADRVLLVATTDESREVGRAIGLLAMAQWSGDPQGSIRSALRILAAEVRRLSGQRVDSSETYA
jgi:hypothetical protein